MKISYLVTSIIFCVTCLAGCGNNSPIAGVWSTKGQFDATGKATAKMTLIHKKDDIVSGTFTFTSLPEIAQKKFEKKKFTLQDVHFDGRNISFIVPIYPDKPKECWLFNLKLKEGTLKGSIKENAPESEYSIAVEFQKGLKPN